MAASKANYVPCPSPACGGKGTYPNWTAALHGAELQRRRKGERLRPYNCPDGHGVHLTTQRTRARKHYRRPAPGRLQIA